MKKMLILFLSAVICMNPMCSGATLDCVEEEVFNEYVDAGSFTYRYETELSSRDYIKIEIISHGVTTEKVIKPKQAKRIVVDGEEMWETTPVFIADSSQVIVYRADCDYVY